MSTAQTGWSFSFFILDWAFVKFFILFPIFLFPFCLFWGRLAGTNDDRVVGFRRRMVFFFDFFNLFHFAWFYGVAFVFLILPVVLTPRYASCCCFFSLPLWVGDNGAGVRIGS